MINKEVYTEVFEILKYMDKVYVMQIPYKILCKIKNNKDDQYVNKIDKNDIYNRDNVLPDTIKYIAWLYVNYWENTEEKVRLKKEYYERICIQEKIKKQEFIKENIWNKKNKFQSNEALKGVQMIGYKEQMWYEKIFSRIINVFRKK